MRILIICLISAVLLVNGAQIQKCYEVTMENDVREEMGYIWATLACNILLLGINITVTIIIFKFIRPAYKEIRKITFFLMDRILLSYMASIVRPVLGCRKEIELKTIEPSDNNISMKEGTSKMDTSMSKTPNKPSQKENKKGAGTPAGKGKPAGKKTPAPKKSAGGGKKKKDESESE